tara:strand:- start:155 stop:529 length:375 start_codon:yes stop_codon:yes gene_type:complete
MVKGEKMYQIGKDDFALIISTKDNKDGKWSGNVDIHTYYDESNKYDNETNNTILNMMSLMSTCVTMMEDDQNFLQQVYDYRKQIESNEVNNQLNKYDNLESKVSKDPKIIAKEGNVIKVNWGQV